MSRPERRAGVPDLSSLSDRDFLAFLKRHLAGTRESLRERWQGLTQGGNDSVRAYSDAMDEVLRAIHDRARDRAVSPASGIRHSMAILAVGGYGRSELCPKSDVDLLFLLPHKEDRFVESITESVLYGLWDLGLEVGHAVRGVKETLRMAAADDSVRTALLDFRFLAGDSEFFGRAAPEFEKFLYYVDTGRFLETKFREMRARHGKYGETVYVLEPNLKEGKGGLRDLHTALWAARIRYKCRDLVELRNKGAIGTKTLRGFLHVRDYLLRVRSELHGVANKKADVLTFEVQEPLAEAFGYRTHGRNLAVDRFLRTYYMQASMAVRLSEEILETVDPHFPEGGRRGLLSFRRKKVDSVGILYKGKINPDAGVSFAKEPLRIFDFFHAMQKTRSSLSAEAKKSVMRVLPALGPELRADPEAGKRFLRILEEPTHLGETLMAMHECRFLGRYLPEFGTLSFRVQRDIYHVYTVDIHLILAAAVLPSLETRKNLSEEERRFLDLYRTVSRKSLLVLAVLFHDIGKGRGHNHSQIGAELVARIGKRIGLKPADVDDLVFLVEQHLLMALVSQRRDMHDIELILQVAQTIGTPQRLDLLYLLTYADMKAVGPDVWTRWKAMLLAELYERVKNVLEAGRLKRPFEERPRQRRERARELLASFPPEAVDRFLARFDDRYFLATPEARIPDHLRLLEAYDGTTPRVETIDSPGSGVSEILVACPDRRGLFAEIAGTLSANGLNILNASIHTSLDGTALDTFYVTYLGKTLRDDPRKKERLAEDLRAVLAGQTDVETLFRERSTPRFVREKITKYRPTRVVFDNEVSSRYTVVDIFTYDRIGLLYDITRTLAEREIDIVLSKISTKADQVADVFYLFDREKRKITDPERLESLRVALLEAIGE